MLDLPMKTDRSHSLPRLRKLALSVLALAPLALAVGAVSPARARRAGAALVFGSRGHARGAGRAGPAAGAGRRGGPRGGRASASRSAIAIRRAG